MVLIAMGSIAVSRARKGKDSEYYELSAQPGTFHLDKNGVWDNAVTIRLWHIKGDSRTQVSGNLSFTFNDGAGWTDSITSDSDGSLTVKRDDSDDWMLSLRQSIESVGEITITCPACSAEGLILSVVSDGASGNDAISIDLDNEMDSIPCDSDGMVTDDITLVTNATLYIGASSIKSGVTATADNIGGDTDNDRITPVVTVNSGVAKVEYTFAKGSVLSYDRTEGYVYLTYNGTSYKAKFTANVVKSGAKGVSPTIYQVKPSHTSLAFTRNASTDAITPSSQIISCGYTKNVGGILTIVSTQSGIFDSNYRIYYRWLYSSSQGSWIAMGSSLTLAYNASIRGLEFCIANVTSASSVEDSNIIDRETVPIVCTGAKGSTGKSITNADVVFVTGDSDTEAPSDSVFSSNGQTLAKNVPSEIGKFLWQATKVTYSDSTTPVYTGKICLGSWDNLITGVEMYTLSDSGTTAPVVPGNTDSATWTTSFTPTKGMYLWECARITDSNNKNSYTTPFCIGYFGTDGNDMEFGIDGTAKGYVSIGALADGETDSGLIAAYFTKIGYSPQNGEYCLVQMAPQKACVYVYSSDSSSWANADSITLSNGNLWLVSQENDSTNGGHVFMCIVEESTSSSGLTVWNGSHWNDLGKLQGPKGDDGPEGPGEYNIFCLSAYKNDNIATPTQSDVVSPAVKGSWSENPQGVSADWPYEYVATRKYANGKWSDYSKPALYANYSANANPNLLDQASFIDDNQMDKWMVKSAYLGGAVDDYSGSSHIVTGGKDGHNYYADNDGYRYSQSNYKDILQQAVNEKMEASTWYTLSFWERCGSNTKYLSWKTTDGTFSAQNLYFLNGHTYNIYLGGYVGTSGERLRVLLYNSSGTVVASKDITATVVSDSLLVYAATADGEYTIGVSLLASDGSSVGSGVGYLNWIRVNDISCQALVYFFPSAIDTTKVYYDGVEYSGYTSDMASNIPGDQYNDGSDNQAWRQHVITFKTAATFAGEKYILFRLMASPLTGMNAFLQICAPKLERGKIATSYTKSDSDNTGLQGMILRDSIWSIGNEYHNDETLTSWPRFLDIVYIERSSGNGYNVWQCRQTAESTAENKPQVSSDGLAIDSVYWKAVNSMGPLYTPLLIAENALIKFGQTNQLLIYNSSNKIQGCFGGVEDEENGYPLWIGGESASEAKFKVKYDGTLEATGANITGTITADVGKIGGFTISSNGLTNIVSQTAMNKADMGYIICRNDYYGRFAGIGANVLPAASGAAAVARFENNDTHSWYTENIAMILEARGQSGWGGITKNTACAINGGSVTGFALGTRIIDSTNAVQSVTLTQRDNVVTCIGDKDIDIYFPDMYRYDDGHVLIIKKDGNCTVRLHPGYYYDDSNTQRNTYMRYDRAALLCGRSNYLTLNSWMDSAMFIFHSNLYITNNNSSYYGSWIEYKLPRDW